MGSKRCEECPASQEYWKWRLRWTGDEQCIMDECRQPDQPTCAYCPIHMGLRSDYKDNVCKGIRPMAVRSVEDDLVFASQKSAADYYSTSSGAIAKVVNKPNLTVRGQHFERWNCFKCAELHKPKG